MILFTIIFVVVTVDDRVLNAPYNYTKLWHIVNLNLCVSYLFGHKSHTIRLYVTFFVAKYISLFGMNVKVFVPFIIVPTPWVNIPNYFAKNIKYMSLSGPFNRCMYSFNCLDIWCRTEFFWYKICAAANAYHGFVSYFEYSDLRLYILNSGEPFGYNLGEPSGFALVSSLGSYGGMRGGTVSRLFLLVWCFFNGMFSICCISGCAWILFVGTSLMFPFLKTFWRSDIYAISLPAILLNGDAGTWFLNACTILFNAIVVFSDADLNSIAHPWEKFDCVQYP